MAKISKEERMHWKLSHIATALSVPWDQDKDGAYTLDATKVIDAMQELIEFFRPTSKPKGVVEVSGGCAEVTECPDWIDC